MPFTKEVDRVKVETYREAKDNRKSLPSTVDWAVGDWCYYYYKPMVDAFKKERRWTTAHNIHIEMRIAVLAMQSQVEEASSLIENSPIQVDEYYRKIGECEDKITAYELAYSVFFNIYVMDYEREKRELNGNI